MIASILLAGLIAFSALLILTAIAFAFDRFAPQRFISERHDIALAGFILVPLVFALALQPRAAETEAADEAMLPVFTVPAADIVIDRLDAEIDALTDRAASNAYEPELHDRLAVILPQLPWAGFALAIWMLGSTIAVVRLGMDLLRLNLMRFQSQPVAVPGSLKLSRPVELRRSSRTLTPLLSGYVRPVIILPADFQFDERARPVLEHEIAHLVRGDAWTVLALRVLMAIFWWGLPLYALERMISRNRETLCDQQAAIITQSPIELAHALLDTAARMRQVPALALAATPRKSALAHRVRYLSSPHAMQKRTTIMRLALILPLLATTALIATPHVGAETNHDRYDYSDYDDASPLYRAAANGRIDRVRTLLEAGANPNELSYGDGTPLMAAIHGGHDDIARALVAAGADPDIVSPGDGTALIAAAQNGEDGVVNLLLEAGANPDLGIEGDGTPLIAAARDGNRRSVELLLEAGADVNAGLDGDGNPLISAAQVGRTDMARLLIDRGADVDGYVFGDETPLINAAQQGEIAMAELLLDAGADLSLTVLAPNRNGELEYRSPLSEAQRMNRPDMVRWLEARGARHNPPTE